MSIADRLAADAGHGLGAASAIASEALQHDGVLAELVEALGDERRPVTQRASNALKKVQQADPARVRLYATAILRSARRAEDLHTRWNLTILLGGLGLKGRDRAVAIDLLFESLKADSALLRVFAMQSLAEMSAGDAALRRRLRPLVEASLEDPSAAMRARARKLMKMVRG